MMEFAWFDVRHYPTLSVQQGYREWVTTYEETVQDDMDLRLLAGIRALPWSHLARAVDFACGTGRIGVWLKQQGVQEIDGIDLSAEMLDVAKAKRIYTRLCLGDLTATPFEAATYDLVIEGLASEHLPDLSPLYREAARLAKPGGHFVTVGYHPHFLLNGIPTHFDRASGESVAIRCYVHLLSDHVKAAHRAHWTLVEMDEGIVDVAWVAKRPNMQKYLNRPVSFSMVWQKGF